MDSASLEQLLASLTPEPHADMVAGASAGSAPAHDGPLALVNTTPNDLTHKTPNSTQPGQHPDQHWNGRRETLGSWFTEFETVLSAVSPELHEFAVEYVLGDHAQTVIFFPGQAAQLDGSLPRPPFAWMNPAPTDAASYNVPHDVISAAYRRLHRERCLRDSNLDPNVPPAVPPDATYPIDASKYIHSLAKQHFWDMRLRNTILSFVSDLPTRALLQDRFPREGRALLDHLRQLAHTPLSTTQVNSVNADIQALTAAGIKDDTIEGFREFGVIYHRLLARIPAGNPSRDPPAMQAMRYIQATIKNRPAVGTTLMHHFASHGVDQNDPAAVRDAIMDFLEEQAAVRRLCAPQQPAPSTTTTPTLPDLNVLKALLSQSLLNKARDPPKYVKPPSPADKPRPPRPWNKEKDYLCRHCGGRHWNQDCKDKRAGTSAWMRERMMARTNETDAPAPALDDADAVAMINAAFAAFGETNQSLPASQ